MAQTEINRAFLGELRKEIEKALAGIAEKRGVVISLGAASFLPACATFKLEVATKTDDGVVLTKAAIDFQRYCGLYGLKPEHLGAELIYAGKKYKLVGCSPKASRFPLIVERIPDGKPFKMPLEAARNLRGSK